MLDAHIERTPFIDEVLTTLGNTSYLGRSARAVARKHGVELLGEGAEVFVIPHMDPTKVIAVHYDGIAASDALRRSLVHGTYRLLFPDNFPRITFIGRQDADPKDLVTGSIRQRIYPHPDYQGMYRWKSGVWSKDKEEDGILPPKPFVEVEKFCKQHKIPLDVDWIHPNFMVGESGSEYYLDKLTLDRVDLRRFENARSAWQMLVSPEDYQAVVSNIESLRSLE
jgi:hypothetical protein